MNPLARVTAPIAALFLVFRVAAAQETAENIVKKVRDNYEKLKSLQADFVQNYTWSLAGETQTVEGKLLLKQGDRYRVETAQQLIVTDGTTVWTYSAEKRQVFVDHLSKTSDQPLPRELLIKYTRDFKAKLLAPEKLAGEEYYRLRFAPKDDDSFVHEVTAWIDPDTWLARKIEQHDINDNVTVYELKNVQRDLAVPDQSFTFKIPDGVEVVDMR